MPKKPSDKSKSEKKKTPLTPRQRDFIKTLAKGATTIGSAAVKAGYSPNNPDQSGAQVVKAIKKKMPELMDELGLTDTVLIKKHLVPLMNAQETKFFQKNGRVIQTRKVEALGIRKDALNMAFMLKGSYAPKTEEEAQLKNLYPAVIILDAPRPQRPAIEVPAKSE